MKAKVLVQLALVLLAVTGLLAACSPSSNGADDIDQPAQPIEITDGLGNVVQLDGPAQRIVSLAPSNTEILYAIGAGAQMVGREDFSNYPAEVADLPSVGGSFGELNTEVMLALEPDLVLAADLTTPEQVQAMQELGLTVFFLANPATLEGMYGNLRTVAQLTGHANEAEALITSLQERVATVLEVVAGAETAPLVFYELDSTDPNAPWTAGAGTFIDMLIGLAGGTNLGAQFEGAWVQVSAETLLDLDPQIILLGDSNYGITVDQVSARPGWETLGAVQNEQVYPFNDDLVSRPGPRLVDGLEELAALLHPELFD